MVKRVAVDNLAVNSAYSHVLLSEPPGGTGGHLPYVKMSPLALPPVSLPVAWDSMNPMGRLMRCMRSKRRSMRLRFHGRSSFNHEVRTLKVDPLARRVGCNQHLDPGVVRERLLLLAPLLTVHAAQDGATACGRVSSSLIIASTSPCQ